MIEPLTDLVVTSFSASRNSSVIDRWFNEGFDCAI
jgi:hypothetical protein